MASIKLACFDLETTGRDPEKDRIVEIAIHTFHQGPTGAWAPGLGDAGLPMEFVQRVNPEMEISEEATAVHGIDKWAVAQSPTMKEIAPEVQALVSEAILVGYNSRSFDTPILDRELRRGGQPGLHRTSEGVIEHPEIDLMRVWNRIEPRTLEGAFMRWCGRSLGDGAHSAGADTAALLPILRGMVEESPRIFPSNAVESLVELSAPEDEVDRAGKFRIDGKEVVFGFGKHLGKPARNDKDYLRWMIGADFPEETKAVARELLQGEGPITNQALKRSWGDAPRS